MPAIRWPDGLVTTASSYEDLFQQIGLLSFASTAPMTDLELRLLLRDRVRQWSGLPVDKRLPLPKFLRDLADAGLFTFLEPSDPDDVRREHFRLRYGGPGERSTHA